MASTEPRAGFRPPWALNVDSDESTDATPVTGNAEGSGQDPAQAESVQSEATSVVDDAAPLAAEAAPVADAAAPMASSSASTPTKFQVDLARAMRAAAETARQESIERLAAESKVRVEAIRASSTDAATELRQRADDDITEIRDWSKGELARIRTETDAKINDRKSWLATEIEAHEESIEVLVSAVTSRVTAFEAELEAFFGRLAEEEDPTRIAVLAQTLPDVPSLDDDAVIEAANTATEAGATADAETTPATTTPATIEYFAAAISQVEAEAGPEEITEPTSEAEATPEATTSADPWADAPGWGRPLPSASDETSDADASEPFAAVERRLAAFGLEAGNPEPAAEAEAVANVVTGEADGETDAETIVVAEAQTEDDAVAEPESGSTDLVADASASDDATSETETTVEAAVAPTETNVVVDGLISVASIAGFKRSVSRIDGVHSVTVSSGPDGEFIFAVRHDAAAALETALPTMPGFGARVTASQAGQISVTAHDAENTSDDVVLDSAGRRS